MFLSKYGVARLIEIPIIKRAVVDFAVSADWTPAAGDVKISKDGGAAANVTNLPTAITMGNGAVWQFSLTATEMQAARIVVTVADSATKAVEDQSFIIETYGNASAQHAVDLADSVRAGLTALPNATAGANGGLPLSVDASGRVDVLKINGTSQTARDIGASVLLSNGTGTGQLKLASGYVAMTWADIAAPTTTVNLSGTTISAVSGTVGSVTGAVGSVTGNVGGNVVGSVASVAGNVSGSIGSVAAGGIASTSFAAGAITATVIATDAIDSDAIAASAITEIQAGLSTLDAAGVRAAIGMGVADYDTDISNITGALDVVNLALTDNLDVAVSTRAATGDAMTLADGAITDAKITFPAEASGRATTFLAAMRRLWEWTVNKRIRNRATGAVTLRNAADSADLETQTQSTSGAVGSEVDTQTKGV